MDLSWWGAWLMIPALVQLLLCVGSAWVAIEIWRENFQQPQRAPMVEAVDAVVAQFPDLPDDLRAQFTFTVTDPRSATPSTMEVHVGEVPARDVDDRLQQKPQHSQTVTLTFSDAMADALSDCRYDTIRLKDGEPFGEFESTVPGDAVGDLAASIVGSTFTSYVLYNGEPTRSFDDVVPAWRDAHGPLRKIDVPVAVHPDGSAGARLHCEVADEYLWSKRSATYLLTTPRLILAYPSGSSPDGNVRANVVNSTRVATNDAFYYLRGREQMHLFPHTAEFHDTSAHGGGVPIPEGPATAFVWESSLVFGSADAEEQRDQALLLLGLLLALVAQFAIGTVAGAWLFGARRHRERSARGSRTFRRARGDA
ncbi:MAG TPA: hypothetical protein VMF51_16220 [Nocardioides sp.]|uniref:hypothetical protein n=1 Tax=Nocardioides sp. TaxID=35761 RepID=UPI002CC360B8|nr:hypothetical protein [Nocardioides sp.]HTW16681.1 hypothetical protein [Nocardioides sp.]